MTNWTLSRLFTLSKALNANANLNLLEIDAGLRDPKDEVAAHVMLDAACFVQLQCERMQAQRRTQQPNNKATP